MLKLRSIYLLIISLFFGLQVIAQNKDDQDDFFNEKLLGDQEPKLGKNVTFYPNPIFDKFSITNETEIAIAKIEIHSIVGNLVRVIPISNSLKDIYIDDLKRGIYFISIHFENDIVLTQKILKK